MVPTVTGSFYQAHGPGSQFRRDSSTYLHHVSTKKTVPPCMYGPGFPIGQGRTRWIRWRIKHRDKSNRRLNAGLRAARAHHMRGADPPPRRRHGPINGARGGGAPTHGHQPRARPGGWCLVSFSLEQRRINKPIRSSSSSRSRSWKAKTRLLHPGWGGGGVCGADSDGDTRKWLQGVDGSHGRPGRRWYEHPLTL